MRKSWEPSSNYNTFTNLYIDYYSPSFGLSNCALWFNHALNPLCSELHGPEGMLTHAWADTSAIWSFLIPALQMFAKERMCFIPYWDMDPHCVSNVLTYKKWLIRTHHYRYSSKRIIHLRILKENGPTDLSFKMIKKRWSCRFC